MLSRDKRIRSSNSKNDNFKLIVYNLCRSEFVTVRLIELTRSDCLSAAMILTSSSGAGESSSREPPYTMTIGMVGQQSNVFKTGVPGVQNSRSCKVY